MSAGLVVENVEKTYPAPRGELSVLKGVNLRAARGDGLAIVGPSGTGKSTLLNIIGTLDRPTAGSVRIDGEDPFVLGERELAAFRNQQVGFVFQEHHLLPQCTAIENVLVPTIPQRKASEELLQRGRRLLERVGLGERIDHRPSELSGGERQRAALARALINSPSLVLADEPTGNLDRHTAETVADLLFELHAEEGFTLIVVTHSERLAARLSPVYELRDARLVAYEGALE